MPPLLAFLITKILKAMKATGLLVEPIAIRLMALQINSSLTVLQVEQNVG